MKTKYFPLTMLLLMAILLGACGPSAEQIAAMTASAWTPTPKPTNTPLPTATATPVPYDLTAIVTDTNGNPVAGAYVIFPESGSGEPVMTDDTGRAAWTNLNGPNVSLTVTAQGYFKGGQGAALERGSNEITVQLERDPFGLLPSDACGAGESLLYAEDFQDGAVENWGTYPPGIQLPIEADPSSPDNKLLALNFGDTDGGFTLSGIPAQENAVRRLKYLPGDHSRFNMGLGGGNITYYVVLSADEISLNYFSESAGLEQKLARGKPVMAQGVWHLLEFSWFNGKIEVWADGELAISYEGANSIPDSHVVGIGSAFLPPESVVRIDDISICGLSAPFASIYVAP